MGEASIIDSGYKVNTKRKYMKKRKKADEDFPSKKKSSAASSGSGGSSAPLRKKKTFIKSEADLVKTIATAHIPLNTAQLVYENYSAAVRNTFNSNFYDKALQEGTLPSDVPKTLEHLRESTLDQLKEQKNSRMKKSSDEGLNNDTNSTDSLVTALVNSESSKLGIKRHKKHKCHKEHGHKHKHNKKHHKKGKNHVSTT